MKILIINLLILFSFTTQGQEQFEYEGSSYILLSVGKKYIALPKYFSTQLERYEDPQFPSAKEVDCDQLQEDLFSYRASIRRCERTPHAAICPFVRKKLKEWGQGEFDENGVPTKDLYQSYSFKKGAPASFSHAQFSHFIAQKFSIKKDKIIIIGIRERAENSFIQTIESIELHPGSLFKLASKILKDRPDQYLNLDSQVDAVISSNRYLSCDLEKNNVDASFVVSDVFGYKDSIKTSDLKKIWELYKILDKNFKPTSYSQNSLVHAALAGHHLSLALAKEEIQPEGEFSIEKLFNNLFQLKDEIIELNSFSGLAQLKDKKYPDEYFEQRQVSHWRLQ